MDPPQTGCLGELASTYDETLFTPVAGEAVVSGSNDDRLHDGSPGLGSAAMDDSAASNRVEAHAVTATDPFELEHSESRPSDHTATRTSPPGFMRRDIHIPLRTSSITPAANKTRLLVQRQLTLGQTHRNMPLTQDQHQASVSSPSRASSDEPRASDSIRAISTVPTTMRASIDDTAESFISSQPSLATQGLAPLQHKADLDKAHQLLPLDQDDPQSFDLIDAPDEDEQKMYSLEMRSELLFSKEHLEAIFDDTASLLRFTQFLSVARPDSVPILNYYLQCLKALRAIKYANAISASLEPIHGLEFTEAATRYTMNAMLQDKAKHAFGLLVRDDLPAFITHICTQVASVTISKRITGSLPLLLREASEGLAEVFCLTDPSRTDNPIIFASEEFHRTTQYGVSYAIGRNCRFLQGPHTNSTSVARFKAACEGRKEHSEVFLNYRRDGSPFMNLLMTAPLLDSRGVLRYFIGAQIDVSGLVKDGTDLDAFQRLVDVEEGLEEEPEPKSEVQQLCEMFNDSEINTVRKFGGNMHKEHFEERDDNHGYVGGESRVLIHDPSTLGPIPSAKPVAKSDGRLSGPYKHYLLIRPAPSLRILFTSPSLRVPGILQSPFLDRIGGNDQVRASLGNALADGSRGVTAKIRWLPHAVSDLEATREEGRPRWIHCTPLLGPSGGVGVWMVVLVDEKEIPLSLRRFRVPPPVATDVRGMVFHRPSNPDLRAAVDIGSDDEAFYQNQAKSIGLAYGQRSSSLQVKNRNTNQANYQRQPHGPADGRNPINPRFATTHDHRPVRSTTSSVKDYYLNGSIPSVPESDHSSFTSVPSNHVREPNLAQQRCDASVEKQMHVVDVDGETTAPTNPKPTWWSKQKLLSVKDEVKSSWSLRTGGGGN